MTNMFDKYVDKILATFNEIKDEDSLKADLSIILSDCATEYHKAVYGDIIIKMKTYMAGPKFIENQIEIEKRLQATRDFIINDVLEELE